MIAFISVYGLHAQSEFDSSAHYHTATVAYENGDVKEEIVFYKTKSPFQIQRKLAVADKDYYNERMAEGKRVPYRKLEKFKPKEVKYVQLHGGPKFITHKYADLSEVGLASIPKNYLLYEVFNGDIKLFLLFKESMVVTSAEILNDSTREEMQRAKLFANSDLIIIKRDEIGKNIATIKIENYIEDKPQILEAYQNGEYPGAKAAYGSRLKGSSYNQFAGFEDLIKLVADYNRLEQ